MPDLDYNCDVKQAYEGASGTPAIIGLLPTLTAGDTSFDADLEVPDPANSGQRRSVTSVLSHMSWGGRATDPIKLAGLMSASNYQKWKSHRDKSGEIPVRMSFQVYGLGPSDTGASMMFFSGSEPLHTVVRIADGEPQFRLEDAVPVSAAGPSLYRLSVEVLPASALEVWVAYSSGSPESKSWGVK